MALKRAFFGEMLFRAQFFGIVFIWDLCMCIAAQRIAFWHYISNMAFGFCLGGGELSNLGGSKKSPFIWVPICMLINFIKYGGGKSDKILDFWLVCIIGKCLPLMGLMDHHNSIVIVF